jgi:hypothetical protein
LSARFSPADDGEQKQPSAELARAFSEVYLRALPDSQFSQGVGQPLIAYERLFTKTADAIQQTGAFSEPERWHFDWEQRYTKQEWLELVPTFGGHNQFPTATLGELIAGLGEAIDAAGGSFTAQYSAIAVTASRRRDHV